VVVFAVVLLSPVCSFASVTAATQVSYQSNDTSSGGTSHKNVLERFTAMMNSNSSLSTKLRMNAILRFDLIKRESDPGSKANELDPDVTLRFATRSAQLNLGYRSKISDTTTITGATTSTRTSNTTEAVADTTIRAGRLPDIRLRYAKRDLQDVTDGSTTSNTSIDDARGSINYRLGIFSANADYTQINTKDKMTGQTNDNSQFAGQVAATKRFTQKVNVMLRENYSFSNVKDSVAGTNKKSQSISEARLNLNPVTGMGISTNYLYRVQDENSVNTTETTWVSSADYALPKFFRFYGTYSDRHTEDNLSTTAFGSSVMGLNFRHSVGKFAFISRYERREDATTQEFKDGVTPTIDTDVTRSNLDWLLSANVSRMLNLALSESYVTTNATTGNTNSNQFRLKASVGPIGNLTMAPYVDYIVEANNPVDSESTRLTTTQLIVPANYRLDFNGRVQLALADNYIIKSTKDKTGVTTSSSSNNAILRLSIPRLMKSVRLDADASFNSSSSNGVTTSNSAYSARMTWSRNPHMLNADFRYQTGSDGTNSTSIGARYGLTLRMRKILMSFSGQYSYGITHGSGGTSGTSQSILLLLTLRN
jgi:hypothetical protein